MAKSGYRIIVFSTESTSRIASDASLEGVAVFAAIDGEVEGIGELCGGAGFDDRVCLLSGLKSGVMERRRQTGGSATAKRLSPSPNVHSDGTAL